MPNARATHSQQWHAFWLSALGDPPRPGCRIGRYEIVRELGRGGMGVVLLGRDPELDRHVAIKLLRTDEPDMVSRLLLEARATARCRHENIVSIYEMGSFFGRPYLVLEYLEGQTLASMMKQSRLSPTRAVEIMVAVARALACAHDKGVVHRDLKPENVFITDTGFVKLLDFGIAKLLVDKTLDGGAASKRTCPSWPPPSNQNFSQSSFMGTVRYMSPEQWGIGGPVDQQSDLWAAGILLFEMMAGRDPSAMIRQGPRSQAGWFEISPKALYELAPDIPAELATIIHRCLQTDKAERMPDASTLLSSLEGLRTVTAIQPPKARPAQVPTHAHICTTVRLHPVQEACAANGLENPKSMLMFIVLHTVAVVTHAVARSLEVIRCVRRAMVSALLGLLAGRATTAPATLRSGEGQLV